MKIRRRTAKQLRLPTALAMFVCTIFPGLPSQAAEKYIFILPALSNPYWQTVKQGIEDGAKETGTNCTVLTPMTDQSKEEPLNLCQTAISQKPAMVVICTTTLPLELQCLRTVQAHGIKVGSVDIVVSAAQAKKSGVNLMFSVGTDNLTVGKQAADYLAANNKLPAPKILVLEGMPGNTNSNDRVAGFKQEVAKRLPGAHIVNSVSAEWDRLKGLNITADTLTRTPDLNVVFAANDMMALGAVEAIRAAGKTDRIMVIGVDGVPDARKAILAGRMTASIAQLPYLIGKRSVSLARDSVAGKIQATAERTPLITLTKPVLESHSDPLLKYVR